VSSREQGHAGTSGRAERIKANAQFWEQMLAMKLEAMPRAEEFCVGAGTLGSVVLDRPSGRGASRCGWQRLPTRRRAMMMQPVEKRGEADPWTLPRDRHMIAGSQVVLAGPAR